MAIADKSGIDWRGVPLKHIEAWQRTFADSREGVNVTAPCPVCGSRALHRYFQVGEPIDSMVSGLRFVARGASWEWCSSCGSYEHATVLVPDWWKPVPLLFDEQALTAEPEQLEIGLRRCRS